MVARFPSERGGLIEAGVEAEERRVLKSGLLQVDSSAVRAVDELVGGCECEGGQERGQPSPLS